MEWLDFHIDTTHEASEAIVDFLSSLGAEGVQVEDAQEIVEILQSPDSLSYADEEFFDKLDPVVHIHAYFARFEEGIRRNQNISLQNIVLYDDQPKIFVPLENLEKTIISQLAETAKFLDAGAGYQGWSIVHEQDWADGWKKYYQTTRLTDRIVINPSWLSYEPLPHEVVLSLDPGSAFGTGTHETTALCAQLLDQYLDPQDSVLDLGCGSGILAIIAAKLGCADVEAIDIDPLAIQVARSNADRNRVRINEHTGELKDAAGGPFDLIAANIIADIIRELASQFPAHLKSGGRLVVSGIIREKAPAVEGALRSAGFEKITGLERNDWCAQLWKKP